VIDLRRLRADDPTAEALVEAFHAAGAGDAGLGAGAVGSGAVASVAVMLEREDVCPVVTLGAGIDFDAYLGTLGKKERHEIRRKIRRAESAGEVRFEDSTEPSGDLDLFIELHQKRWGGTACSRPRRAAIRAGSSSGGLLELGVPAGSCA